MWNDQHRYYRHQLDDSPIFPRPENYNNLDYFLHDIRQAIRDEKHFRRQHKLTTTSARLDYHLDKQADSYFDVI